ncbi:hypothetical protein FPANT_5437 [Fusarium pseudoanthophilum]|uniref:Zn(2)-C6 fungal-type domain-containing protein n=1 Tax=Fusarium pseudoanthophilum TaxID=48495 RepID=A0A8H5UM99_9HYPO|nr:hypothetical protein FPANT_5437 [Fusarium pseudoanthophilum]
MENLPTRARSGSTSCAECCLRRVRCVFDGDKAECQECTKHSLTCQPQNDDSSPEGRDDMPQEFTQFSRKVESRMILLQTAIELLTRRIDAQATTSSKRVDHKSEPSYRAVSEPFEVGITLEALKTPHTRLTASLQGLVPEKSVLTRILHHSSRFTQNWASWPLATVSHQQQDDDSAAVNTVTVLDAGFPTDVNSALEFIEKSLSPNRQKPPDPGAVAKCIVWLCLSIKELPMKFKYADNRAPAPFEPMLLISDLIRKVESLYRISSTPVCNIDFVQALLLQGELSLAIGCPTKAWKCIRTAIENAMLLGVHQGRSSLHRAIWEELWIQDRQLSLFLGMPHAVPAQLGPRVFEEQYPLAEKQAIRQIAMLSGLLTSQTLMKEDTTSATITRTLEEMKELNYMIPDHWTRRHLGYVPYLPQAFTRAKIKILYHSFELMLNWPKCQLSNMNPGKAEDFEPARKAILASAQEIIKAQEAMRAPELEQTTVMRADFVDFLAFKAALLMIAVIKHRANPMPEEESKPLWRMIDELADRFQETTKVYDDMFAKQACLVLKILFCASEKDYIWCGAYEAVIPYFGRLQTQRVIIARDWNNPSHTGKNLARIAVVMESDNVVFGPRYDRVPELELAADWTEKGRSRAYGWRTSFDFECLTLQGF